MALTHTCESAGVWENIKVNGQSRPAKLSGILLTWHLIPVNWTVQLTDGYVCSCPLLPLLTTTQVLLVWSCFTFSLISFLSSFQLLPFICPIDRCLFPSWWCLSFSSFILPQTCSSFSHIGRPLNLGFIGWLTAFDYSLPSLNLVLFWSFKQKLTGCLFLILKCSRCPCSLLSKLKEVLGCPVAATKV